MNIKQWLVVASLCAFAGITQASSSIDSFVDDSVGGGKGAVNSDPRWAQWLLGKVSQLPSQQALAYRQTAADFQRKAGSQPLYNPELGVSVDDKLEQEISLVISQTLDWSGKRGAQTAVAEASYEAASQGVLQAREALLAQALQALVDFHAAEQLLLLAREQRALLDQLNLIVVQRQRSGDLQQLDAELSYLSQAQVLPQLSSYQAQYYRARASLKQALDVERPGFSMPSSARWVSSIDSAVLQRFVGLNPSVVAAKNQLAQLKAEAEVARLAKKVDPTIGLEAGKDGDEDYLALNLSVPLNFRNNYSAEYQTATSRVFEAEIHWRDQVRRTQSVLVAKRDTYLMQAQSWQRWQQLTEGRAERSKTLLAAQWQTGDLSTRAYLYALQQRSNALVAGVELASQAQSSWIEWLLSTQQVEQWLTAFTAESLVENTSLPLSKLSEVKK